MTAEVPSPQTTLLILLGASEWPFSPQFQSSEAPAKAFANAAQGVKDYFRNPQPFELPAENLLDLFDSEKTADEMDSEIGQFLEQRLAAMKETGKAGRDLLLYFIGHGGFAGDNREYYLAIRRTRAVNPLVSGLPIVSLAYTLKEQARHLRRILILDCCFAAAAFSAFQGGPDQVALEKTIDAFRGGHKAEGSPTKGTTLFCSSDQKSPSVLLPDYSSTMFTAAFLDVLRQGTPSQRDRLTLRDVKEAAWDFLSEMRDAPRPVVNSPDQSEGDVADIPFFPNPVVEQERQRAEEERARIAEEERVRLAEKERVRKAEEDRRRQAEAERARLAEVERVKKAEEGQERPRRAEEERRRQAEEETKAHQAEEGRIDLRPGIWAAFPRRAPSPLEARDFLTLDWKAEQARFFDPHGYAEAPRPRMEEDHRLLMERGYSEEVQRFVRLDNAVRAWNWYSIHTAGTREGSKSPSLEEVVRAWMEENPGFQLEQRPLRPMITLRDEGLEMREGRIRIGPFKLTYPGTFKGLEMTVERGEKPVFRIRLTNTRFGAVSLTTGVPLRPGEVARVVMVVGVFILNLLSTSVGLGILLHAWWIAVICLIGESLLVYIGFSIMAAFMDDDPHFSQRSLKLLLLVPLLPIGIAWGLVGWFLNPFVSLQVHFPYSILVLAAVGFLLALFVNFFICYRLARTLDWYHRLERRLEG